MIYRHPIYLAGVYTLVVWSRGTNYHFQLPSTSQFWYLPDPLWREAVPFPVRYELNTNTSFLRNTKWQVMIACSISYIVAAFFFLIGLVLLF
jgi:hypothetical protein